MRQTLQTTLIHLGHLPLVVAVPAARYRDGRVSTAFYLQIHCVLLSVEFIESSFYLSRHIQVGYFTAVREAVWLKFFRHCPTHISKTIIP
jgi:hypothetical protein